LQEELMFKLSTKGVLCCIYECQINVLNTRSEKSVSIWWELARGKCARVASTWTLTINLNLTFSLENLTGAIIENLKNMFNF